MAFTLLSAPCVSALAATKKELGSAKLMWFAILFQCFMGYVVALIINVFGNLFAYSSSVTLSVIFIIILLITIIVFIRFFSKETTDTL